MQHHAAKLLDGCKNLKYEERVTGLDLPSLAYRLAEGDVLRFTNLSTVTAQFSYQKNLSLAFQVGGNLNYQFEPNIPENGGKGVQTNSLYYRRVNV